MIMPGVYLFAVAPVIYDENASADTLRPMYITCIDDASIFHRKVPKRTRARRPPPPPSPTNPLPSNLSPRKLEAMRARTSFTDVRFCHYQIEVFPFDVAPRQIAIFTTRDLG